MHRIFTTVSNERALPYWEHALYWQSGQARQAHRGAGACVDWLSIVESASQLSAAERLRGSGTYARGERSSIGVPGNPHPRSDFGAAPTE
jgi:hypothetical protein